MTITQIGELIEKTAARKRDRGGNSMNLVSEVLVKLNFNDKRRKYKVEENKNSNDFGYVLYQSLEYDFKYLKNDDFGFRGNLLNTNYR